MCDKKTGRGSIKSNPMLKGDMNHDVSTGSRNAAGVFGAVVKKKSFVSIVNIEKGQMKLVCILGRLISYGKLLVSIC